MRKWVVILVLMLILAIAGYEYLYQDHRNIAEEKPELVLTATSIHTHFLEDSGAAEQQYNDKTIVVSGMVSESNPNSLTLDGKVFCQFNAPVQPAVAESAVVKIKGRIIGYDDLLELIKLDQCTIIN